MKVMHLSDLHICAPDLKEQIYELARIATKELGTEIEVGIADDESLKTIRNVVQDTNPDCICITGDITTFGDALSFVEAAQFLAMLRERGPDAAPRIIVVTPGNHDALCGHLQALLSSRDLYALAIKFWKLRKTTRRLKRILQDKRLKVNSEDPLANFNNFVASTGTHCRPVFLGDVGGRPVWCVPFDSVSLEPKWMNLGDTSRAKFHDFYNRLRERGGSDTILIAMLHHNPISSPDAVEPHIVHAYNSMPGSAMLMREMQNAGADLVLFGHQHEAAGCIIDFMPEVRGHVYLLGSPSATCGSNSGVNLIQFEGEYVGRYKLVTFNAAGNFSDPYRNNEGWRTLALDSERPVDELTLCAKHELKHFRYRTADSAQEQWDGMHNPGAQEILMVGPRMRQIGVGARSEAIRKILEHHRNRAVKILFSDPALYDRIKNLGEDDRRYLSEMWGDQYTWEVQAEKAQRTLQVLTTFRSELPPSLREKFQVRVSHTLLPIGGIARDVDLPEGSMLIRLLPVGRMGQIDRPLLRFTRRHPVAVYSFFRDYLGELWKKGRDPWGGGKDFVEALVDE